MGVFEQAVANIAYLRAQSVVECPGSTSQPNHWPPWKPICVQRSVESKMSISLRRVQTSPNINPNPGIRRHGRSGELNQRCGTDATQVTGDITHMQTEVSCSL